jgi:hypothetical protein
MEGSHQKGSNWYRCRFVTLRGPAAADASGHPRVLGIKEDIVLDAAFDFLGRRIFGLNRLWLLREELARSTDSTTSAKPNSRGSHRRRSRSIAPSTARRSALKSTTTRTIQSSRSQNRESKD